MGVKVISNRINHWWDEMLLWEKSVDEAKLAKGLFDEKDTQTKAIKVEQHTIWFGKVDECKVERVVCY